MKDMGLKISPSVFNRPKASTAVKIANVHNFEAAQTPLRPLTFQV
jgi:hypothetical protein